MQEANGVFRAVGVSVLLQKRLRLSLVMHLHLLCREKERGRALIFMPAWTLMALSRQRRGMKRGGGQGSSCLLSVVFE